MRPICLMLAAVAMMADAAPVEDEFDQAVTALTAGLDAADGHDPARLRLAARALQASAARPVAGTDLAEAWLRRSGGVPRPVERDRVLGPGYRALQLGGGKSTTFEQAFLAGQLARVAIVPRRRSDFLMQVREDDRSVLCRATPAHARCDWVASYTTRFRIEISNPGRRSGEYLIVMQ